MDTIFGWCVDILFFLAGLLGITYQEINVWIFVIIWPTFTIALIALVIYQQVRIRGLEKRMETDD